MTDLVERVARAIGRHVHIISGSCDLEAATRAAIAAMREPTIEMCDAAVPKLLYDDQHDCIADAYNAMIDEALK